MSGYLMSTPRLSRCSPDDMAQQKQHLTAALAAIVASLRSPEKLTSFLHDLGIRHVGYQVKPEHYPIVGQTLLAALADVAGDAWSEDLNRAWADAYAAVQAIIFEALDQQAGPTTA